MSSRRRAAAVSAGLAILAVLGVRTGAAAAPPDLGFTVSADRTAVSVGDRVVVTYRALLPKGGTLALDSLVTPAPGEGAPGGAAPVLEFEAPAPPETTPEKDGAGRTAWTLHVALIPFLSGKTTVPGPHLTFTSASGETARVRPPSVDLEVGSRLPPQASPAPAPATAGPGAAGAGPPELEPKADRPFRIPARSAWFWAGLAAAAAALAALVLWLVRRRRRTGAAPGARSEPELPPHVELGRALDALEQRAGTLGDDPRPFYTDLTHAGKRYLERSLSMPVLEWTTFETLRKLREAGWEVPREVGLPELLGAADRVKFGRGAASAEEARRHVENARRLLAHVEARLLAARAASAAGEAKR